MADKRSSLPVWLGVVALFTCCFPLGLVAIALGVRDLMRANADGSSKLGPVAAIALGSISLVIFGWGAVLYARDQKAHEAQLGDASAKADKFRKSDTLTLEVATALGEEYLLSKAGPGTQEVKVEGALEGMQLNGVVTAGKRYTLCFKKSDHWFVYGAPRVGGCPPAADGATDDAVRDATAAAFDTQAVEFVSKKIRDAAELAESDAGPARCSAIAKEAKVAVLDPSFLPGGRERPVAEWKFLSTSTLLKVFAQNAHADDAEEANDKLSSYLLVLTFDERSLPEEGAKKDTFIMGEFSGDVRLVDMKNNKVLCTAPLEFESSDELETRKVGLKVGPKVNVGDNMSDDFEKHYKTALNATLKEMTGGKITPDL
jgi:hypothetical protein